MIQISTGDAVTLLLAFAGLMGGFGRVLMKQFDKRIAERFKAQDQARELQMDAIRDRQTAEALRVAGLTEKVDNLSRLLPLEYVRREDWIRFSASIDHKLDRLAEMVMKLGGNRARD